MPPAIEEDGVGKSTRVSLIPTRGGSTSVGANHTQHSYQSIYLNSTENQRLNGDSASSRNRDTHRSSQISGQTSGLLGQFGAIEPAAFETTRNQASGSPRHQQPQFPAYASSGPPSRPVPYQVQRSPQFQAQGSAQSALGFNSNYYQSVPSYTSQASGEKPYSAKYHNPPALPSNGSGHGHDFEQPVTQVRYHAAQPQHVPYLADQQRPSSSYSSPYVQSLLGFDTFPAQQHNILPSRQLAIPDSRVTQHQPSASQTIPRNTESPVYHSSPQSRVASSVLAKRGRPAGKNIKPSFTLAVELNSTPPAKRRGRPSKSSTTGPTTESVSVANPNVLSKRRGRPFKTAESAAKAKAKENGEYVPKKRGRPQKNSDQIDIPVPPAYFMEFGCEWKGCTAKLHNLEALRMHITAVHGAPKRNEIGDLLPMEWVCAWKQCDMKDEIDASDDSVARKKKMVVFESRKEWKKHIEELHMKPYSWHMGDGLKASGSDPNRKPGIDPWLLNEKGEQVTPAIVDLVIEGGFAKLNNQRRWAKEKRRLHLEEETEPPTTGSFMKTEAQVVQEERANDSSRTGSDEPEANEGEEGGMAAPIRSIENVDDHNEGDEMMGNRRIEKGQVDKLKAQYTIEDDVDSGADEMLLN